MEFSIYQQLIVLVRKNKLMYAGFLFGLQISVNLIISSHLSFLHILQT